MTSNFQEGAKRTKEIILHDFPGDCVYFTDLGPQQRILKFWSAKYTLDDLFMLQNGSSHNRQPIVLSFMLVAFMDQKL